MSRRAAIAKYALLGGFSGALYGLWHFGFLMAVDGPGKDAVDYIGLASAFAGAGLFYGIIVGAALRGDLGFGLARWALLALAAAGSYFAAVEIALAIDPAGGVGAYTFVAGATAGAAGGLLLALATAILVAGARKTRFVALATVSGALLGLLQPLTAELDTMAAWTAFFAVWQAGYAAATAFSLRLTADRLISR